MLAVYKREMRADFTTPIGYVVIALYLALTETVLALTMLFSSEATHIDYYFLAQIIIFIIMIPLLTMKLFSEERKLKTEQLLLTSPVSLTAMVFAKFCAAFTMFCSVFIFSTVLNTIVLSRFGEINIAVIIGNAIGILLIGAAFCAIGVFFSALTENQIVAAVSAIATLGALVALNLLNLFLPSGFLKTMVSWISIWERYNDFTYGMFNIGSLVYFLSFVIVFLFLTVRVYERKRWA